MDFITGRSLSCEYNIIVNDIEPPIHHQRPQVEHCCLPVEVGCFHQLPSQLDFVLQMLIPPSIVVPRWLFSMHLVPAQ